MIQVSAENEYASAGNEKRGTTQKKARKISASGAGAFQNPPRKEVGSIKQ